MINLKPGSCFIFKIDIIDYFCQFSVSNRCQLLGQNWTTGHRRHTTNKNNGSNLEKIPVSMFWKAVSTLVESSADVSIKLNPLRSANAFASSVGIDLEQKVQ